MSVSGLSNATCPQHLQPVQAAHANCSHIQEVMATPRKASTLRSPKTRKHDLKQKRFCRPQPRVLATQAPLIKALHKHSRLPPRRVHVL